MIILFSKILAICVIFLFFSLFAFFSLVINMISTMEKIESDFEIN